MNKTTVKERKNPDQTKTKAMKKTCYTLLIALASLVMVQAQDNDTPAAQPADTSASAMAQTNTTEGSPAPVEAATNAASTVQSGADTNATPTETISTTNTTEAATASATSESTNAVATQTTNQVESTESDSTADTNAPVAASVPASIPRIQFNDVPIRTAIENLARLANINYMLDPKIGYGQPDANGQIKPEPTLSIRWENITAENALLALLDNYGLQLIRDKNTGIARITLKDPTAPPPLFTKVVQLKYAGVSNIVDAVRSVLTDKRSKVLADSRTSQLIVVGTDPEQQAAEALINQLDKPTRQVLIETRLAEISSNPQTKKGVDWTGTLGGQNVSFGNNVDGGQGGRYSHTQSYSTNSAFGGWNVTDTYGPNNLLNSPGLLADTAKGLNPSTFFLDADGLSAVLSFLNSSSDAKVTSTPRIVTLDNETANISVTRTYPVFQVTAGTANAAGGSSVTYSNVGTILHVTPRITANDYIWMSVLPEVSSFFGNFTATIGGVQFQAPQFDTRSIKTDVLVPNSNTLVLGGLVQDSPHADYTKVPLLGDIPGLGFFFRSENKSLSKDNLLIFITPTIVQDTDFQPSQTTFFKNKAPVTKDTMNPSDSWDSAQKAGEWVNPDTYFQK